MEHKNSIHEKVKETEVITGLKLVTTEYSVKVPVFEETIVKVPKFVDEPIKIPTGFDTIVNVLALDFADKVMNKIESMINDKLSKAIDERIKEIKVPKITEEVTLKYKDVDVERPIYKDREIILDKVILVDKEVINPILKDTEIVNAIIIDKPVLNAVVTDIRVTNCIVKDVEVERAVIREKIVEVIHKTCIDAKGNRLPE